MKKRLLIIFSLILLLVSGISPDFKVYASGEYVIDNGKLLSNSEEAQLRETLGVYSDKWDVDIVIVTEDSIGSSTPMAYADDYYDNNGYGKDGILLLVSMENRDWWISTSGSCIDTFTDAGIDYIGKQITDNLSSGDYYKAFDKYADLCDDFLKQDSKGKPYDVGNMPDTLANKIARFFGSIVTAAIGAFATVFGLKSKNKSVRHVGNAKMYEVNDSLNLTTNKDRFLYTNVIKRRIESSSSGGGGSSVHTGSSGSSHGGGGGHF